MGTVVGIDLGTTNSAICWINPAGQPEVLVSAEGQRTTPSVVQVRADGTTLVGELAKREAILEKENTAHFFKREMGGGTQYRYHRRDYTPTDLSAEVLKKVRADAEARLNLRISEAVITVPAYFENNAREETRRAGEMAGLRVLEIINEPTAAAFSYKQSSSRPEVVLVYDLGGGTFDVSLVSVTGSEVQVIGTDGNHTLGGKDWDDRIVTYVGQEFQRRQGIDPLDDSYTFQEILIRAEEAKKSLTSAQKAVIALHCQGKSERIELTRPKFHELSCDLLEQTAILCDSVLREAGYSWDRIDSVLMVGGSTRMPACRELVQRLSGKAPNFSVNPDECVAIGAALYAQTISSGKRGAGLRRIKDVTSHSMGMVAISPDGESYINSILIPKNSAVPDVQMKPYQAPASGRDGSVSVYVTQGESERPLDCTFVGKYVIRGFASSPKERAVLAISYAYDASGVITVTAKDRRTSANLTVEKEPIPADMSWLLRSPKEMAPAKREITTIYAAVDLSGSMAGGPLKDASAAVSGFIDNADLSTMPIGLISFADSVKVNQEATQNANKLMKGVWEWQIGSVGIGNEAQPFDEIRRELAGIKGRRFAIVLTDGMWADQKAAERAAQKCHDAGIEIIALGFGSADEKFLKRIATADQAALFSSSADLADAFEQIAQVLVESPDQPVRWGSLRKR
jgi:molecular chaperone DnaK (HSP70)